MIGNRIRELRKQNKMTQLDLADRLNVEFSNVSKWELGKNNPSMELIQKIAIIFNVSIDYLLGQTDNPSPTEITPVKKVTNPHEAFEKDEEERFVAKAKESPCALLFMLMLYEGLRTSEAKAICPADIKADYILVNKSIDDLGNFTPTKTCNVRKVPIFEQFKPWADKYRGENKTPCLGKVNKHTGVKEYREICDSLGITKNMYCLRHTFATRC